MGVEVGQLHLSVGVLTRLLHRLTIHEGNCRMKGLIVLVLLQDRKSLRIFNIKEK